MKAAWRGRFLPPPQNDGVPETKWLPHLRVHTCAGKRGFQPSLFPCALAPLCEAFLRSSDAGRGKFLLAFAASIRIVPLRLRLMKIPHPPLLPKVATLLLTLAFAWPHSFAQVPALPDATPPAVPANAPAEASALREISPGIFQIGSLRLDKAQHTVTFPGRLNMAEGALEYLLVTPGGSTHESLLVTEIQPTDLHFAMLLLGAKGAGLTTPAPEDAPPAQLNKEYLQHAPKLQGDAIRLRVKWKAGDAEKTVAVEDWLLDTKSQKAVARGPWIYTGSMFKGGQFLAQVEGTLAALVTQPSALINNPRPHNDDDTAWEVNAKAVPGVDTPLEIIIQLETAESASPE